VFPNGKSYLPSLPFVCFFKEKYVYVERGTSASIKLANEYLQSSNAQAYCLEIDGVEINAISGCLD